MEKEFCPYEQALALKELGFDEPCFYQYVRDFDNDGELIPIVSVLNLHILRNNAEVSDNSGGDCFAAPLYQQAFSWFRNKYKIDSNIKPLGINKRFYSIYIVFENNDEIKGDGNLYNTYEEAELECLKKLIEIVKNDK